MPLFFPQDFLEDLRARAEIVECIGDYVLLTRRGNSYVGLCPFHTEKTPSFSLDPQKQLYYCFGCGAGGDLLRFVQQYERVEFPEAVEILAHRYGLPLPEVRDDEKRRLRTDLYAFNEDVLDYFRKIFRTTSSGKKAFRYLQDRGFEEETIDRFQIGYAPDGWDHLHKNFRTEGVSEELLLESGLVVTREHKSGSYDRFRNRIIFPIRTHYGKVAGFGGRILGDGEPKYLNSPQTLVYEKGRLLYGLDLAKKTIQQEDAVILVEGYLDVIRVHQSGFANVVGALGTSFTSHQAQMLRRYAPLVVMNFDADAAGEMAARRSIQELLAAEFTVQVLVLPSNLDPDDFLSQYGAEDYRERLDGAVPFFEYLINQTCEASDLTDAGQKRRALEEILPVLCQIKDRIARTAYFPILRDRFQIDHRTLLEGLKSALDNQQQTLSDLPAHEGPSLALAERRLLKIFMEGSEQDRAIIREAIPTEVLSFHEIWSHLLKDTIPPTYADLLATLDNNENQAILSAIAFRDEDIQEEEVEACLTALHRDQLSLKLTALQRAIEQETEEEKNNALLEKKLDIGRQIDKLN